MGQNIAPESEQTVRAREKLEQSWKKEKPVTPEAVRETVAKIHQWIAANAQDRLPVEGKGIALFNLNKDPAPVSERVRRIAKQLELG